MISHHTNQVRKGHIGGVTDVGYRPDGQRIVTGSYGNTAKVWESQRGREVFSLQGHRNEVLCVAFRTVNASSLVLLIQTIRRGCGTPIRFRRITVQGNNDVGWKYPPKLEPPGPHLAHRNVLTPPLRLIADIENAGLSH